MGICILGIGDCNSTTTTDISNITNNDTTINNSIKNEIQQNCNMDTIQSNTINIVGSTVGKLSATQKNSIQGLCIMQSLLDSNVSTDVQNKLLDKIKNNVETEGSMLGSPASNQTVAKNVTTNKTNIDNSKFNQISKNCIINTKQSNLLNIIGSNVQDSNFDQANDAFMKCLSSHSDTTKVTAAQLADTSNATDNTTKAAGGDIGKSIAKVVSSVGDAISGMISAYMIPITISVVACIIACIILSVMSMWNPSSVQQLSETATNTASSFSQLH